MEHVFEAKIVRQKIADQELKKKIFDFAKRVMAKIEKILSSQVDYKKVNDHIQETRAKYDRYRMHF